MSDAIKERYEWLQKRIKLADEAYFADEESGISDSEYDDMVKEVGNIEKEHPHLKVDDSISDSVGTTTKVTGFAKIAHTVPMLSISKSLVPQDYLDWDAGVCAALGVSSFQKAVERKMDGGSLSVVYVGRKLSRAVTRGDGGVGDLITDNARVIKGIPHELPESITLDDGTVYTVPEDFLEVRGEVFMPRAVFNALNDELIAAGKEPYANARNTASGSMKLKDPKACQARGLEFMAYILLDASVRFQSTRLSVLAKLGFQANQAKCISDPNAVSKYCDLTDDNRDKIPYDIDGMVIKVNDTNLYDELGSTSASPRWVNAWKFKPTRAETVLESVDIQVGRTGNITPVANVAPVSLNGTTVRRATLHNFDEIALRLDLHEGDTVIMEKGGEIIPKIVGVVVEKRVPGAKPVVPPKSCPECGSDVEKAPGQVDHYCTNMLCPAQLLGFLEHFVGRRAMNVESVGPSVIELLVESGLVKHPIDFYALDKTQLVGLGDIRDRRADNIISGINSSKVRGLAPLIYGLGIRHVGENTAKDLAKAFGTMEDFVSAPYEDLVSLDGVGEITAASIRKYIDSNSDVMLAFKRFGLKTHHIMDVQGDSFKGETVCITGTLPGVDRDTATVILEKNGARVTGSVSKKTTILVAGADAGSKLKKATDLGIKQMSWPEVLERIGT